MPLILTSCAAVTDLSGYSPKPKYDALDVACELFVPIHWSASDTDATIREVKEHNQVWLNLCGATKRPAQSEMPTP